MRGKVWSLAIGNELNITHELFDICLARAKERWRSLSTGGSELENEGKCGAQAAGRLGQWWTSLLRHKDSACDSGSGKGTLFRANRLKEKASTGKRTWRVRRGVCPRVPGAGRNHVASFASFT